MDASEFVRRLERRFGRNVPVFTGEILEEMGEYSRPRVFQLLALAEEEGYLAKFAKGIYYIPTKTRYGRSILSVEQVVEKKYVSSDGEVYGIYAGLPLLLRFLLSTQVPTAIEVVTNKETNWAREAKLKNRTVILRKPRCPITKDNADAYTILELFSNLDMDRYKEEPSAQKEVARFIKKKNIKGKDVYAIAGSFPSKTMRNLAESGVLHEFA